MTRIKNMLNLALNAFRHRYLSLVFRLAVGIIFIVSSVGKLSEGSAFVDDVTKYQLLTNTMAEAYATALPWVEIIMGSLLILGLFSRVAAGIGVLTSLSFIIANGVVLHRGLNLTCGCFGDMAALQTREAIIIECVLMIMAVQIMVRKGDFLSLDSVLFRRQSRGTPED
ncbi:MAG: DoxX family membrane protein [Dehalococcoidia bacterium]|nr:MAG: DoxX family membrane protein [Dehalococcoidia bacterium]UCG84021.1 MAG: DoxX family membrane protein [Dehalococcoidia bacterium]